VSDLDGKLVAVLELWDWYASIGRAEHLTELANDLRGFTAQ
jgi:hypothetical protein